MKIKNVFLLGVISLVIFIGIASYLWYLYFHEYEEKIVAQNTDLEFSSQVELINSGSVNYLNATNTDDDNLVPTYYFRVKNSSDKDYEYILYIENVQVNDGCTEATTFSRDELEYELKLDNKVVKSGGLETIQNNVLNAGTIAKNTVNDYSLKVRLKATVTDYTNKHFHYKVTMKEKK